MASSNVYVRVIHSAARSQNDYNELTALGKFRLQTHKTCKRVDILKDILKCC